jgi:uracil-DNA glycosylase
LAVLNRMIPTKGIWQYGTIQCRLMDENLPTQSLSELNKHLITCQDCPRLVAYREQVSRQKRSAYADQLYWGKPVPGMGDPDARLLLLGLAPGAHGANRTGRMFTGDKAGDFVFRALVEAGFCRKPGPVGECAPDFLRDIYLTNIVRCVPPANLPTRDEQQNCQVYLNAELNLLANVQVVLALGKIAFDRFLTSIQFNGAARTRPRSKFQHGQVIHLPDRFLVASYHPSQRNTQTGRLTMAMFLAILKQGADLLR